MKLRNLYLFDATERQKKQQQQKKKKKKKKQTNKKHNQWIQINDDSLLVMCIIKIYVDVRILIKERSAHYQCTVTET